MEQEIIQNVVKEEVEKYMKTHVSEIAKALSPELINENGNATVKHSGNGIVYVDNSGIAYVMALFFYHMSDKEFDFHALLSNLNEHMSQNYENFEKLIEKLTKD